MEGVGELWTVGAGAGTGGGGPKSVTEFLYCRDTAGPPLRGGVVGFDGEMESALDTFQGRVARRLTGRQHCWGNDRKWFYPSLAGVLKEAGVVRVRTSILWRQNTVAQFIATRPVLGLCEVAERRRGKQVPLEMVGADGH